MRHSAGQLPALSVNSRPQARPAKQDKRAREAFSDHAATKEPLTKWTVWLLIGGILRWEDAMKNEKALEKIKEDIVRLKQIAGIRK